MQVPFVLVMQGLPASGKTTLCGRIAAHCGNAEVVCIDQVRDARGMPDDTLEEILAIYRSSIEQASHNLSQGKDVFLDGTFWRESYCKLLRAFTHIECELILVRMLTDPAVCDARTQERAGCTDQMIAERHLRSLADLVKEGTGLPTIGEVVGFTAVVDVDGAGRVPAILGVSGQLPVRLRRALTSATTAPQQ